MGRRKKKGDAARTVIHSPAEPFSTQDVDAHTAIRDAVAALHAQLDGLSATLTTGPNTRVFDMSLDDKEPTVDAAGDTACWDAVGSSLSVPPLTPPDGGEAGGEHRCLARPSCQDNAGGAVESDATPDTSCFESAEVHRKQAQDDVVTPGADLHHAPMSATSQHGRVGTWHECDPDDLDFGAYTFSSYSDGGLRSNDACVGSPVLGQSSDPALRLGEDHSEALGFNATAPLGPRSSGTCPGGGCKDVSDLTADTADGDLVDSLDEDYEQLAVGREAHVSPFGASDFYSMAKRLLPEVYGTTDGQKEFGFDYDPYGGDHASADGFLDNDQFLAMYAAPAAGFDASLVPPAVQRAQQAPHAFSPATSPDGDQSRLKDFNSELATPHCKPAAQRAPQAPHATRLAATGCDQSRLKDFNLKVATSRSNDPPLALEQAQYPPLALDQDVCVSLGDVLPGADGFVDNDQFLAAHAAPTKGSASSGASLEQPAAQRAQQAPHAISPAASSGGDQSRLKDLDSDLATSHCKPAAQRAPQAPHEASPAATGGDQSRLKVLGGTTCLGGCGLSLSVPPLTPPDGGEAGGEHRCLARPSCQDNSGGLESDAAPGSRCSDPSLAHEQAQYAPLAIDHQVCDSLGDELPDDADGKVDNDQFLTAQAALANGSASSLSQPAAERAQQAPHATISALAQDGDQSRLKVSRESLADIQRLTEGFSPGPLKDMMLAFVARQSALFDGRDAADKEHRERMRVLLQKFTI